jgi:hypothetical protein
VFQFFQMPRNERDHSQWLLSVVDPQNRARSVLSLGCGVAGMESYWKIQRPELEFELVNISQPQLDTFDSSLKLPKLASVDIRTCSKNLNRPKPTRSGSDFDDCHVRDRFAFLPGSPIRSLKE